MERHSVDSQDQGYQLQITLLDAPKGRVRYAFRGVHGDWGVSDAHGSSFATETVQKLATAGVLIHPWRGAKVYIHNLALPTVSALMGATYQKQDEPMLTAKKRRSWPSQKAALVNYKQARGIPLH